MATNPYKPFYSVLVLAFFCSAMVAGAAVGLRPKQEANRTLDQKKNILYAAGLYDSSRSVEEMFQSIETRVVELSTGDYVANEKIDPVSFNQERASMDNAFGAPLPDDADLARLGRVEKYSLVYLVRDGDSIDQIILPVRGKGLWSTMYAYVAVDNDLSTIRGISFYAHGETPGLGGEIENKSWQSSWKGKQIYGDDGQPVIELVKGMADAQAPDGVSQVDGLSGATLTANGVSQLMQFWFGENGFKPYFAALQQGGLDG